MSNDNGNEMEGFNIPQKLNPNKWVLQSGVHIVSEIDIQSIIYISLVHIHISTLAKRGYVF